MRSLIKADMQRILKKPGFWIFSLLIILLSCFTFRIRMSPADGLRGFHFLSFSVDIFAASAIFFGFLIFSVVYCDEFRSMAFITVLGKGMDRLKLVLAKLIDTVILTAILFTLLGIAGIVTSLLMGANMNSHEIGLFIYSLCSDAAETLISMSLASVFIYITEKIPVSIFVLLILKLVSAVVEMLNGSARDILERLYFTEILRNAWTELVLGAAGKSIFTLIFCLICYLAICVGAIHFTFGRKELSF